MMRIAACLALALGLSLATPAHAAWKWQLSKERYGTLTLFERAQYDKARHLFESGQYRAAAAQFEKYKVQFPDSPALPYVLFMRGYSLCQAKDRHAGIKIYNEVLDFFGDEIEDAAAALYYLGVAHLDNGDLREGLEAMTELVQDEDYQKQPVAAGALRRLADNNWRNGKHEEAVAFWKQAVRDFAASNPVEAGSARDNVTDYYIKAQKYRDYESWLIDADNRDDSAHRKWVADQAFKRAWGKFHTDWGKYNTFNNEERKKDIKAFYQWYKQQKTWYDQAGDPWAFYRNAVYFVSRRARDRKETLRLINESMPLHDALKEQKARNDRYAWLADRMREAGDWTACRFCIGKMTDPLHADYIRYQMAASQRDWTTAITHLVRLEKANDRTWSPRALGQHAWVCKDVLHQYEAAIKLYQQMSNPPDNLWAIQDCYRRWGKLDSALTTLTEIENSFPDHAAKAAWKKAEYYHAAGQAKQAVSAARRVLKLYPKSAPSSKAHQLLEGYGIATGGGLLDEE